MRPKKDCWLIGCVSCPVPKLDCKQKVFVWLHIWTKKFSFLRPTNQTEKCRTCTYVKLMGKYFRMEPCTASTRRGRWSLRARCGRAPSLPYSTRTSRRSSHTRVRWLSHTQVRWLSLARVRGCCILFVAYSGKVFVEYSGKVVVAYSGKVVVAYSGKMWRVIGWRCGDSLIGDMMAHWM